MRTCECVHVCVLCVHESGFLCVKGEPGCMYVADFMLK